MTAFARGRYASLIQVATAKMRLSYYQKLEHAQYRATPCRLLGRALDDHTTVLRPLCQSHRASLRPWAPSLDSTPPRLLDSMNYITTHLNASSVPMLEVAAPSDEKPSPAGGVDSDCTPGAGRILGD